MHWRGAVSTSPTESGTKSKSNADWKKQHMCVHGNYLKYYKPLDSEFPVLSGACDLGTLVTCRVIKLAVETKKNGKSKSKKKKDDDSESGECVELILRFESATEMRLRTMPPGEKDGTNVCGISKMWAATFSDICERNQKRKRAC